MSSVQTRLGAIAALQPSRPDTAALSWTVLAGMALLTLLLRLLVYTGFFGSDEVTYVDSAFKLLDGDWKVDDYVGANRYGVNLPMAAIAALFGRSEASAAAYSLACSVGEVVLLAALGTRLVGRRAALMGTAILAFMPLHLHIAGRLMADAPLSLALTASFLFFFDGELRERRSSYFLAGAAVGFTFWVKPAVLFYAALFFTYPIVFRRWNRAWIHMVAGALLVLGANFALMGVLTGNAMFLIDAMRNRAQSGYLQEGMSDGSITQSPATYLVYLFAKVQHTGLMGPLAALGVLAWAVRWRHDREQGWTGAMVVWWGLGLLLLLSALVISLNPLTFIPKQSNYMLIFAAPLALLGGMAVDRLGPVLASASMAVMMAAGLSLGVLQQVAVHSFTANSRATLTYARQHPAQDVFAATNGYRASLFEAMVRKDRCPGNVREANELLVEGPTRARAGVAVVDPQSAAWAAQEVLRSAADLPACASLIGVLPDVPVSPAMHLLARVVQLTGGPQRLRSLAHPEPAQLFAVPGDCVVKRRQADAPSTRP